MKHRPRFHVIERDKLTWLYDRTEPVFCFNPDKVMLRHVRLRPHGYPLVEGHQVDFASDGWPAAWGSHGTLTNQKVLSLNADDSRPRQFTMRVVSDGPGSLGESDWRLTLSYDDSLGSYVYDVDMTLDVKRGKEGLAPAYCASTQFQYFDLYCSGMADPKVLLYAAAAESRKFDRPLWDYFVYEDAEFYDISPWWIRVPLNRFILRNSCNIRLKRDGRILLANSRLGNPVVQLLGDTAAWSTLDQCNMLYDMHFRHVFAWCHEPPPVGTRIRAQWRMMDYDTNRVKDILARAEPAPVLGHERLAKAYPRYEEDGINGFEEGLQLDAPDHSRVWRPFHGRLSDGEVMDVIVRMDARLWDTRDVSCTWDRTCGRTGTSSVKVRTRKHAVAGWQLICFDMLDVDPGTAYEVSAYIKTEGLTGRGATVGYLLPGEHLNLYFSEKQNPIPHFARTWVSGTTAWTRVGLTTKRPVEQGRGPWRDRKMQVALWHEGKGASWFDDVRIRKARHR